MPLVGRPGSWTSVPCLKDFIVGSAVFYSADQGVLRKNVLHFSQECTVFSTISTWFWPSKVIWKFPSKDDNRNFPKKDLARTRELTIRNCETSHHVKSNIDTSAAIWIVNNWTDLINTFHFLEVKTDRRFRKNSASWRNDWCDFDSLEFNQYRKGKISCK